MVVFNLSTFPEVCRLCLQSKHPDELVSVETIRPLFDRKLSDLLEGLTFKVPADVLPYFPSEVCLMCLEVFDFFYKYKQKMNYIHRFLVAFAEVKLGNDQSLVKLFNDHNEYFSILFKDLDLCNKDELLVEDILEEYPQYKIASMPVVKREASPELVSETAEPPDDYEYHVEVLEEQDDKAKGAFLVERLLEELGQVKQNEAGEKLVEIKAEPVRLLRNAPEASEPGVEEVPYCDSEHLEDYSDDFQEGTLEIDTNDEEMEDLPANEEDVASEALTSAESKNEKESYSCGKCKYKTVFKEALTVHEKRHEQNDHLEGIHCSHPSCLKVFPSKAEYQKHLKQGVHKQHVCDICGASLKHKYSLEVHLSRHAGVTQFQCTYCSSSFYTKTELRNHMRSIHTTGERWECSKCKSVFKNRKLLNQHLESHVEERNFKCTVCDFAFKTMQHLKRHITTVHKEVRFHCEHCSMSYGRKDKLRMHMERAHNIQSYFICDICVRTFNNGTALAEHKTHHANPKPLECPVCLLAFENKRAFEGHLCITYREDYVCCERDFKFHVHYNRHMLTEHGVKSNARVKPTSGVLMGQLRAGRRKKTVQCRMCRKVCPTMVERRKHEAGCAEKRDKVGLVEGSSDGSMPPIEEMGEEEHLEQEEEEEEEMVDEEPDFIIDEDVEEPVGEF
ncbi:zinc finger protein 37-like [Ochlerotatus camptorhynchus]|uniref:zinc finger protein 37-like n=1 Tax=Ochlerotatus camptorhynchus TaxID=644619 RepID=UPI0031E3BD46